MSDLSRRTFLSTVSAGTAALVTNSRLAGTLMAGDEPIGAIMPTEGETTRQSLPKNENKPQGKYRPPTRFGMGGVAIGNGFAPVPDEGADATMKAAWDAGVRYFDTSPWYGLGLSERRMGHFLDNHAPEDYVISTKIGRLLSATDNPPEVGIWKEPSSFDYRYDYSAEGTRRSIEDSLQRLGVSQIDIVFIHDLSPDNGDMGDDWTKYFDTAKKGAMRELSRMRDEGMIKAWGMGVNRPEPALRATAESDPDLHLLATQYSLMDHEKCLHETLPKLDEAGVSVVVGAPLNAGYLAGRERYHYNGKIPDWAPEKRRKLKAVCEEHGVDLKTAALQFCLGPQVVSAVIPGARNPGQIEADSQSMKVAIPDDFWDDLKRQNLIAKDAPAPKLG